MSGAAAVALLGPGLLLQAAVGQTHLLIVAGLGGEPAYADEFREWSVMLADAARTTYGLPAANIVLLSEDPARDPTRIRARSTRENVLRELAEIGRAARPNDQLVVVLIGHGSAGSEEAKINLPGPDLTAEEFARALEGFGGARVVFVNTASASGGFVPVLSATDRVVITATRSGHERNLALFGRFFAEAFAADGADADKNGGVSMLEAFVYANSEVSRFYETENRLQSEHAVLDDNGDGEGSRAPGRGTPDGGLAAETYLSPGRAAAVAVASSDPRLAPLYEERSRIESEIDALRARKDALETETYDARLEELLVELALNRRAIQAAESAASGSP